MIVPPHDSIGMIAAASAHGSFASLLATNAGALLAAETLMDLGGGRGRALTYTPARKPAWLGSRWAAQEACASRAGWPL